MIAHNKFRLFRKAYMVATEYHVTWTLHDVATWSFGTVLYDYRTYYFTHLGRVTICLEGRAFPYDVKPETSSMPR